MKVIATAHPEVIELVPPVFKDERGAFFESFNQQKFNAAVGGQWQFVQDNHSTSTHGVVRGLHYQIQHAQGKLVRVIEGEVLDVFVDLRKSSSRFGSAASVILSAEKANQLWVPPGFAHGFIVLSASAQFLYKTTDYWAPSFERTLLWNDPALGVDWQLSRLSRAPIVNAKDQAGVPLASTEHYA
jgi:dTDP-4-dehydrorhamnose 3,5-epimerase